MSVREVAISDLGRIVTGKTPVTKNPAFFDGEYQFVTPSDLDWKTYYCQSTERTVTDEAKKSHKNLFIPADAVMVTCIGNTIGKCGISSSECLTNQQINTIIPADGSSPRFVYYLLIHNTGLVRGVGLGGGAATPILNKTAFLKIKLQVPPKRSWDGIASILSAYDDLIENNRRRIQLLEQAARLLYKEWFVHLRFPGHEHVTITDGVPEGWGKSTVAEVCTAFEDGDWIESKDQGGEDYRLLQISNIGDNYFVETGNFRYITAETFRKLRCNEVVPGDILISRMPKPIGRAWYVYEQPWRMITAVDVTIARPNPDIVDPFYYLYHLNSPTHIARCELRETGATRPRVSRKNMGALPILKPQMSLQRNFGETASAINAQRNTLTRQNKRLTQARDLLLPRLMNGEIEV